MDFVDVDTSKDVKLFLDPLLLSDGFRNIVNDFVNTVYKMYTLGNKAGAFQLFSHSKECNAIHFGYSESHEWATFESQYVLAPNENGVEELLILVPKSVVSKRFLVNPSRYISVIFQHLQLMEKYQRTNGTPKSQKELRESEIVANYQKDKDKSYILDMTLLSPEYYEAYYDNSIRFSDNKSLNDEELIEILTNK